MIEASRIEKAKERAANRTLEMNTGRAAPDICGMEVREGHASLGVIEYRSQLCQSQFKKNHIR